MSKYIDLTDTISRDNGTLTVYAWRVLKWLDEHPDQVPGRTITRTEYRDTLDHAVKVSGHGDDWERGFFTGLTVGGTRVVPDPEPTNAEKLEALLEGGDINAQWGLRGGGVMFARELAHALDEAGVKAP